MADSVIEGAGILICVMRRLRLLTIVAFLLGSTIVLAGTPGTFRGTVVSSPGKEKIDGRWIYIKGRNGMLRRVEISRASVSYEESVPKAKRQALPELSLQPGAEVRVTAEQDSEGEWRAKEVEVLGEDDDDLIELPPGHPPIDATRGHNRKI